MKKKKSQVLISICFLFVSLAFFAQFVQCYLLLPSFCFIYKLVWSCICTYMYVIDQNNDRKQNRVSVLCGAIISFSFAVIAYCTKNHQYFGSTNEEEALPSGFDDLYYIQVFVCLFSFLLLLSFITSLTISFYFIRRYSRTKNPRNSFFVIWTFLSYDHVRLYGNGLYIYIYIYFNAMFYSDITVSRWRLSVEVLRRRIYRWILCICTNTHHKFNQTHKSFCVFFSSYYLFRI